MSGIVNVTVDHEVVEDTASQEGLIKARESEETSKEFAEDAASQKDSIKAREAEENSKEFAIDAAGHENSTDEICIINSENNYVNQLKTSQMEHPPGQTEEFELILKPTKGLVATRVDFYNSHSF